MNVLDVVIIGATLGAGFGGWRLGLVARVFAWAGVFTGLAIGVNFVPRVVTALGGQSADDRFGVALLFLFLVASIGQAVGLLVGLLVHRVFPIANPLPLWDKFAGASAGALGLLVLTWLVIPSLATAQGWPARLSRNSWMVAAIERVAPAQPAEFAAWGLAISDAPYPSALGTLQEPPDPGTVPSTGLSAPIAAQVRQSILKVSGDACHQIQDGSGWVAAPGLVVTNAHVVAGESSTSVIAEDGTRYPAVVVDFDPVRDVAVLAVPKLQAAPLTLGTGRTGDVGAVFGHPGGGDLVESPSRIGEQIVAVGTTIYRTARSKRHVFVLAAALAPGDSGGALVDRAGSVVGMAFAIDPGRQGTSYALTDEEVRPALQAAALGKPADTGACLVE